MPFCLITPCFIIYGLNLPYLAATYMCTSDDIVACGVYRIYCGNDYTSIVLGLFRRDSLHRVCIYMCVYGGGNIHWRQLHFYTSCESWEETAVVLSSTYVVLCLLESL